MNTKTLSTLGAVLLPVVLAVPQFASADQNCVANECQVAFEYTGNAQTWHVPEGAFNIRFELYGASGGGGAKGGYTSGELLEGAESLTIVVGGAGQLGENSVGGFNGGGAAGSGNTIAGSGGGATDLRLSNGLESRIAVAGGGGGAGGQYGPSGGKGGGASAQSAPAESGQGGQGGKETEGGAAGAIDGIFRAGDPGSFGQGGKGGAAGYGSSGGGGGGWYGGGGGGGWESSYNYADVHTSGGGGGSSYASPEWTRNANLSQGVWLGDGRVVIHYQLQPEITQLEGRQVNRSQVELTAFASGELTPLSADDLVISDTSCQFLSSEVTQDAVVTLISGCQQEQVEFSLSPRNYLWRGAPTLVLLDHTGPTFEFLIPDHSVSASELSIPFTVSDNLSISAQSFQVSGCTGFAVTAGHVELSECSDGPISLDLQANVFFDSFGNAGPQSPHSLALWNDMTMPTASWSAVSISSTSPHLVQVFMSFSEPVTVGPEPLFSHSGSSCSFVSTVFDQGAAIVGSCDGPQSRFEITGTVMDLFGNPLVEIPEPLVVVAEVQTQSPAPSTGSASHNATTSSSITTQIPISESSPEIEPTPTPIVIEAPASVEATPVIAPISSSNTNSESVSESLVTSSGAVDVATESQDLDGVGIAEQTEPAAPAAITISDSLSVNVQLAQEVSVSVSIEPASDGVALEPSWPLQPVSQLTIPSPHVAAPAPQVIRVEYPAAAQESPVVMPILETGKQEPVNQETFFPWQFLIGLLAVLLLGTVALRFSGK